MLHYNTILLKSDVHRNLFYTSLKENLKDFLLTYFEKVSSLVAALRP